MRMIRVAIMSIVLRSSARDISRDCDFQKWSSRVSYIARSLCRLNITKQCYLYNCILLQFLQIAANIMQSILFSHFSFRSEFLINSDFQRKFDWASLLYILVFYTYTIGCIIVSDSYINETFEVYLKLNGE